MFPTFVLIKAIILFILQCLSSIMGYMFKKKKKTHFSLGLKFWVLAVSKFSALFSIQGMLSVIWLYQSEITLLQAAKNDWLFQAKRELSGRISGLSGPCQGERAVLLNFPNRRRDTGPCPSTSLPQKIVIKCLLCARDYVRS